MSQCLDSPQEKLLLGLLRNSFVWLRSDMSSFALSPHTFSLNGTITMLQIMPLQQNNETNKQREQQIFTYRSPSLPTSLVILVLRPETPPAWWGGYKLAWCSPLLPKPVSACKACNYSFPRGEVEISVDLPNHQLPPPPFIKSTY